MANGIGIEVDGLEKLIKKIGVIPENLSKKMDAVFARVANDFVNRAVNDAPVDQNILRDSITAKKIGRMEYEVVSAANWSAFIEWGTKSRVQVPADLQSYAEKFKGLKAGTGTLYDNILKWVKRTGLAGTYSVKTRRRTGGKATREKQDETAAFLIARSIFKNGVHAHPFFFKQMPIAQAQLNALLDPLVKQALQQ